MPSPVNEEHREKRRIYMAAWFRKNRVRHAAYKRAYRALHPITPEQREAKRFYMRRFRQRMRQRRRIAPLECPRCGGQLLKEDGDAACLQCGHRVVELQAADV